MPELPPSKPDSDDDRAISRRTLLSGAGAAAAGAVLAGVIPQFVSGQGIVAAPQTPSPIAIPVDPTAVPGIASEALSPRSPFENPALAPIGVTTGSTLTPLHELSGTITPSDLVFQRSHNGIALIDPKKHSLMIHGLVDRPRAFSVGDLKRFPAITRTYFIECSGNGRAAFRGAKAEMTPQMVDGMTSNCEWTGVPLKTLFKEVGAQAPARWFLAEGGDASKLSRSIPMEKGMDDALIAWAQNGEPLRPGNGYPIRLLLPGYEGNASIKWVRRIELGREPWMFRDETSKYTDPLLNDTARQFSFVLDAKSIITAPAYPSRLAAHGWWPIRGLAWTGRGKIDRVDVSTDGGTSWTQAEITGPVLPFAHARFQLMWKWDGQPARLMSRVIDETGYVQPTLAAFIKARGIGTDYHFNYIRAWDVAADGTVTFGVGA